jgi:hypothetical protein
MRNNFNTYYPSRRKALHAILAAVFLLYLLPAGAHAKVPCTGMRCHQDEMPAMQHSKMESIQNPLHGCCAGGSANRCRFQPANRIDLPDCVMGSCRGDHHRNIYKASIESDAYAQHPHTHGYAPNHPAGDKTVSTPIYLQNLALRF